MQKNILPFSGLSYLKQDEYMDKARFLINKGYPIPIKSKNVSDLAEYIYLQEHKNSIELDYDKKQPNN